MYKLQYTNNEYEDYKDFVSFDASAIDAWTIYFAIATQFQANVYTIRLFDTNTEETVFENKINRK